MKHLRLTLVLLLGLQVAIAAAQDGDVWVQHDNAFFNSHGRCSTVPIKGTHNFHVTRGTAVTLFPIYINEEFEGGIKDVLATAPVAGRISFDGRGNARLQYTIAGRFLTVDGYYGLADNCKLAAVFGFGPHADDVLLLATEGILAIDQLLDGDMAAPEADGPGHPSGFGQVFWFNYGPSRDDQWTFAAISLMLISDDIGLIMDGGGADLASSAFMEYFISLGYFGGASNLVFTGNLIPPGELPLPAIAR